MTSKGSIGQFAPATPVSYSSVHRRQLILINIFSPSLGINLYISQIAFLVVSILSSRFIKTD